MQEENKIIVDAVAATATGAAYMSMVPDVVAIFTGVYVLLRIWETDTVRRIVKRIQGCDKK